MLFNAIYKVRNYFGSNIALPHLAGAILIPLFLWLFLALNAFLALAALVGIGAFLLVARYPHYGLYLMILSVPLQDKVGIPLGGQKLTATQAAVLLTAAAWFVNRCTTRKPFIATPNPPILKWLLIYILTMVISLATAFSLTAGLAEISRWLITLFAYVLATSVIETRRQFWGLVAALVAGGFFEAGLGVVQTGLGIGPESFAISDTLTRAFGTFVFPNPYAGYLEMSLPIVLALFFLGLRLRNRGMKAWLGKEGAPRQAERKTVIWGYVLMAFCLPWLGLELLAVVASYSRGAWLGLAVAGLVMVAVRGRKSIGLGLLILVVGITGYIGLETGAISPSIATRISSVAELFQPFDVRDVKATDANYAVVERMAMWQAGGNMFLYNPWTGVGIGNFDTAYNNFNAPDWIYSRGHAHNYYINAAAETGIIGAVAYLLLVLGVFGHAWKTARRTRDRAMRYVAWGGLGVISSVMIHNLVENLHVLNLGIQWCGVIALFYLAGKLDKAPEHKPAPEASPAPEPVLEEVTV